MPKFKKISADEARAKRNDHIRNGAGGEVMVKGFKAPPSWNKEQRSARFIMSSESVDRYGDIVVQAGLDLTRFLQNPQGLLFHNSRSWPAGNWSDVTKVLGGRPKRTEGTFNFLPEGTDEDADRAARHVAAGSIRTVSIGFAPDWDQVELILDDEEEWVTGLRFNVSELLEGSLVPIPAQPDALVKDAGGDFRLARDLIEEVLDTYAKTPEGLLIPMTEYEKAYKTVIEKIEADTVVPAVAVEENAASVDTKDDDEPECEPMEGEGDEAKSAESVAFKDFLDKSLNDGDEVHVYFKLEGAGVIEKGVTISHQGTDKIDKFEFAFEMTAEHKAAITERLTEIAAAKAATPPENKPGTVIDAADLAAEIEKAHKPLFAGLMDGIKALFSERAPASADRIEPVIVEPAQVKAPDPEAARKALEHATLLRARLATNGRLAA